MAALTSVACTFGLWFCWDTGGRGFTVGPVGGLEDPIGNNLQQPFLARCCRRSLSSSSSSSSAAAGGTAAGNGGSSGGGGGGGNGGKCLNGDINPPPFLSSLSTQTPRGSTAWCVGGMDRVPVVEGAREEGAPLAAGLILLPPLAQATIERGVTERAAGVTAHEDGGMSLR